jgi:hypothetical protein
MDHQQQYPDHGTCHVIMVKHGNEWHGLLILLLDCVDEKKNSFVRQHQYDVHRVRWIDRLIYYIMIQDDMIDTTCLLMER